MRKFRNAVALAAAMSLSACQTLEGVNVNGVDAAQIEEAQNGSFCGRNLFLCISGGVIVALAATLYIIGHSGSSGGERNYF